MKKTIVAMLALVLVASVAVAGNAGVTDPTITITKFTTRANLRDVCEADIKQLETAVEATIDVVDGIADTNGNIVISVVVPVAEATTARVLTSADYGKVIMLSSNAAVAVTLPANGAPAGSWVDVMTGAGSTDACAPTISAATTDTLVGPNDQDLKSVTWATTHRIGAYAKFISDGSFWHVLNLGGTTMTYTD